MAVCIAMEDSNGKPGITRGATVEQLNGTADRSAYFIGPPFQACLCPKPAIMHDQA